MYPPRPRSNDTSRLGTSRSLPSRLPHPSPLLARRTPAGLHLPDSVQPAGRALGPETPGSEPPPTSLAQRRKQSEREGAPAPDSSHWPSRLPVPALLFPPHRPLGAAAGPGLPVRAERRAEGGAVWRRKQARPGGGSAGRTMDSQGRKVVVCDNGTGVRPGGTAACVCGARAGPSAARLGCGGAGGRARGRARGGAGGRSGGAGRP